MAVVCEIFFLNCPEKVTTLVQVRNSQNPELKKYTLKLCKSLCMGLNPRKPVYGVCDHVWLKTA